MQRSTQHPRRLAWLRRLIVVAVLAAAVGALLSQTVFAQTSYIITDGDRVTVHRSYSSDPYEVLTEAGIELEEEDTYETGYADGMNQITVRRMQMVTVINRGAQSVIGTYGETAGINTNTNRFSENVTAYDKNGNIKTLQRYGQTAASGYGLIDNLQWWFRVQGCCEAGKRIHLRFQWKFN